MASFYSEEELKNIGLKAVGKNVLLSKKASIYGANQISIGDNVRIDDFCILSGKITFGNNIHIAAYTALYGGESGIDIGDFVGISTRCSIFAASDDYSGMTMSNPTIPDQYKNVFSAPVVIGRHMLMGSTCVILPGVTISEGCSFGSFSLVNKDTEPWTINAGIPSKKIKDRSKDLLNLEKQYLQSKNK